MPEDETSCLVVIFRSDVKLAFAPECPSETLIFDGLQYQDQGYGAFTGFYDWLRNRNEEIIGIRYFPFEDLEFLCGVVRSYPYVVVNWETKGFDIFFSDERVVDESISDDQQFGDNKLFMSNTGEYALSFNADGIKDAFKVQDLS